MSVTLNNPCATEQAFLDTIQANPQDDFARIVYADWLEEHGFGVLSDFWREVKTCPAKVQQISSVAFELAAEMKQAASLVWKAGGKIHFGTNDVEFGRCNQSRNQDKSVRNLPVELYEEHFYPEVIVIDLSEGKITSECSQSLQIFSTLAMLNLANQLLTEQMWEVISQLSNLERLSLSATNVSNGDLEQLVSLPILRFLSLANTCITDDSFEWITRIQFLASLDLYSTAVTIEGLSELIKLDHLRELRLHGVELSSSEFNSLQQLLPYCKLRLLLRGF